MEVLTAEEFPIF